MMSKRSYFDPKKIVIDTGNVLRPDILSKTSGHDQDQLCEGLKIAMSRLTGTNKRRKHGETESPMPPEDCSASMKFKSEEEREQSIVTVKLFPNIYTLNSIREAVESAIASLGTTMLDYLVLALHPDIPITLWQLEKLYVELESLVKIKKIKNIAISEIQGKCFILLFKWAKVKPGIQIYSGEDSAIEPFLENFIKKNSVQVLKHKDPTVILPHYILDITLMHIEHPMGMDFERDWLARIDVSDMKTGEQKRRGYTIKFTY